jgi:nucleotide-binding universal stress UspA family protein/hemerythrin-like domain-containing protein
MYRHLLVPIDGSRLSQLTVEQAVAYARSCGARVTFFHARPDYGATGEGALLHAASREAFAERAAGTARAVLAKAEAAARAAAVDAASVAKTRDNAHEAILETAHEQGCDLIFMASHGKRGLAGVLLGSVTQKVLQGATLPVLIAAVESNLPETDEQRAIATIKDEHRSLAAVIDGLQHAVRRGPGAPNFTLLRAMLFYIEAFPERMHHPKEESHLFARLRARTRECDAVLDELQREHRAGEAMFARLRDALAAFEQGADSQGAEFAAALGDFAGAQLRHMATEERLVLPAASLHLTAADWTEVARAFHDSADPRLGAERDESFRQLFARLLNLQAAHVANEAMQ